MKGAGAGWKGSSEKGAVPSGVRSGTGTPSSSLFAESRGGGKETHSWPPSENRARAHPPRVSRAAGRGGLPGALG